MTTPTAKQAAKPTVLMIVTLDTKAVEAYFIRQVLEARGVRVIHLDASIRQSVQPAADITPEQVAEAADHTLQQVRDLRHEGKCQAVMTQGATRLALALHARSPLDGIIALGGSMGSSLASTVMRAFPYGLPKMLISTMASGFTRPFVGAKDIILFNPVCDVAGLNRITTRVFQNAAVAVAAMARAHQTPLAADIGSKPVIAMGTLGTIDRCTVRVRRTLEERGFEVLVFHAQGTGGMALDAIVQERDDVVAVIDASLAEHNDYLHDGVFNAGPDRSRPALEKGIPVLFAAGNADFMVGGPLEEARKKFPGKRFHAHNLAVTAVRTDAQDLQALARHLAALVRQSATTDGKIPKGPVSFFIPLHGFSSHDSPEGHLHDPSLCPVFYEAVRQEMPDFVKVEKFDCHINDATFADALAAEVLRLVGGST